MSHVPGPWWSESSKILRVPYESVCLKYLTDRPEKKETGDMELSLKVDLGWVDLRNWFGGWQHQAISKKTTCQELLNSSFLFLVEMPFVSSSDALATSSFLLLSQHMLPRAGGKTPQR